MEKLRERALVVKKMCQRSFGVRGLPRYGIAQTKYLAFVVLFVPTYHRGALTTAATNRIMSNRLSFVVPVTTVLDATRSRHNDPRDNTLATTRSAARD